MFGGGGGGSDIRERGSVHNMQSDDISFLLSHTGLGFRARL